MKYIGDNKYYSIKEISELLNVSEPRIYQLRIESRDGKENIFGLCEEDWEWIECEVMLNQRGLEKVIKSPEDRKREREEKERELKRAMEEKKREKEREVLENKKWVLSQIELGVCYSLISFAEITQNIFGIYGVIASIRKGAYRKGIDWDYDKGKIIFYAISLMHHVESHIKIPSLEKE